MLTIDVAICSMMISFSCFLSTYAPLVLIMVNINNVDSDHFNLVPIVCLFVLLGVDTAADGVCVRPLRRG